MSRVLHRLAPALDRPAPPIAAGLLYYPGVRCPSCGGRHFAIGRSTAECAGCSAPLILSHPDKQED